MDRENYNITIEVTDKNGKTIKDVNGATRFNLQFEKLFDEKSIELYFYQLSMTLKTWMPEHRIEIRASLFNSISSTFMVMFSFYVDENKFIKH